MTYDRLTLPGHASPFGDLIASNQMLCFFWKSNAYISHFQCPVV